MPGLTRWRSSYPGTSRVNLAANSGRSGRGPDRAHLAAQDVEQLRQLVERGVAQPLAHCGTSIGSLDAAGSGPDCRAESGPTSVAPHRAELEKVKFAATETDPPLAVDHRARRTELDGDRDREHQRRQRGQRDERADAIDRVLDREPPALGSPCAEAHERQASDVVERRTFIDRLVEPRDDRHLEARVLAAPDDAGQLVVALPREREYELTGPGHPRDGDGLIGRAQDRELRGRIERGRVRVEVQKPDRVQAERRLLLQAGGRPIHRPPRLRRPASASSASRAPGRGSRRRPERRGRHTGRRRSTATVAGRSGRGLRSPATTPTAIETIAPIAHEATARAHESRTPTPRCLPKLRREYIRIGAVTANAAAATRSGS